MSRRIALLTGVLACAALVVPLGCGSDDGLGQRYQISGKVTYNGQPLSKGTINFAPVESDGHPAGGQIVDGAIKDVGTASTGDGVLPGKYRVAITAIEEADVSGVSKKYGGGFPDSVEIAKAQKKAKKLIPAKYGNAFDSGLTADVSSSNRTFNFDLKD